MRCELSFVKSSPADAITRLEALGSPTRRDRGGRPARPRSSREAFGEAAERLGSAFDPRRLRRPPCPRHRCRALASSPILIDCRSSSFPKETTCSQRDSSPGHRAALVRSSRTIGKGSQDTNTRPPPSWSKGPPRLLLTRGSPKHAVLTAGRGVTTVQCAGEHGRPGSSSKDRHIVTSHIDHRIANQKPRDGASRAHVGL